MSALASVARAAVACIILLQLLSLSTTASPTATVSASTPSPYPNPHLSSATDDGFFRWRPDLPASVRTSGGGADRVAATRAGAANYSDWMGEMMPHIGHLTLKDLILPGTHDSGAFELSHDLAPDAGGSAFMAAVLALAKTLGIPIWDIITPWALAQSLPLGEQARAGVRYFDLRVCHNGTTFLTHHFETGRTISELVADLNQFVRAHPTEIIVVEAQLLKSSKAVPLDAKLQLAGELQRLFAGLLYPESDRFNRSIAELVSRNQRVLLSVDDQDLYDAGLDASSGTRAFWWGPSVIWNTYANSADLPTMQLYDTQQVKAFNANSSGALVDPMRSGMSSDPVGPAVACGRYGAPNGGPGACSWKISWTLTPDAGAILASLTPGRPTSLLGLAGTANAVLDAFVGAQWMSGPPPLRMGNILIVDDVENTPLMDIVLKQNLQAALGAKGRVEDEVKMPSLQRPPFRSWPVPVAVAEE